jgi:membrane dipeptidase
VKIVDLHCDTISRLSKVGEGLYQNSGHFDLQRALQSKVVIQFFALYTTPADSNTCLRQVLKQLARFHTETDINQDCLYHLKASQQICKEQNQTKIGGIQHLEGAECLGADEEILDVLYHLGLRSLD